MLSDIMPFIQCYAILSPLGTQKEGGGDGKKGRKGGGRKELNALR